VSFEKISRSLGNVAHAPLDDPVGAEAVDALAGQRHLASSMDETQDAAEGRGLAHPVATEYRGDAGRGNVEGDVLDDLLARDRAAQIPHLKDSIGGAHLVPVPR
jgi:hypothetical protein